MSTPPFLYRDMPPKVTPLELTTKLMEAAKARGAEVRIATVTGVSSAPVKPPSGEEAKEERGRRITAVVLEDGGEIPCDRVGDNGLCSGLWRLLLPALNALDVRHKHCWSSS